MFLKKRFNSEIEEIKSLSGVLGIEPLTAELLLSRGINTKESAIGFLRPRLSELPDFKNYRGVVDAIERIRQAKECSETVVVYGDYDCDGICASVILSEALKENGIATAVFIPKRLEEGYGLCVETLEKIAEEYFPDLIITVDCGITSKDEVDYCMNELGIDVIVTDHHEPPMDLPECIVVNPHLDKEKNLYAEFCGAGVAFMLVSALYGIDFACKYIDVAAIATMGDIVPLSGANRILVKYGIKKLMKAPIPGLKQLIDSVNIKDDITGYDISFKIVPRINSLGRLGDASRAISLFTERDYFVLSCLIKEMNDENAERQQLCLKIEEEAKLLAREFINEERAIILCGDWHKGILGITASKLVEKFNRPVILFTIEDNEISGSCRSIPGINIYDTLSKFSHLYSRFGGHSQAAGLSMPARNFKEFQRVMFAHLKSLPDDIFAKTYEYDADVTDRVISDKFLSELKAFEPFGYGNPKPVFHTLSIKENYIYNRNNPVHISAQTKLGYSLSGFYKGEYIHLLNSECEKHSLLSLSKTIFNGREFSQGILDSVIVSKMPEITDPYKECVNFAKSARFKGNKAKVFDKNEFYRILIDSFKSNPYGNIAICYTLETYNELSLALKNSEVNFESYYNIKTSENTLNCVIYSPQNDYFEWYDNCFFVDRPLSIPEENGQFIFSVTENCKLKEKICSLKLDRSILGEWFIKIKKLINGSVFRTVDGVYKSLAITSKEEELKFYLAWLIFEDVGLIDFDKEKNAFILKNIKTELTNSSLYCIINDNE